MKKKYILIGVITVIVVFVSLFFALNMIKGKNLPYQVYTVTKDTELYDNPTVNAGVISDLSVGTKLIPADQKDPLICETKTETDKDLNWSMTFTLCYVRVMDSQQTGWVLKKWIE
jgi:hypothetical protein